MLRTAVAIAALATLAAGCTSSTEQASPSAPPSTTVTTAPSAVSSAATADACRALASNTDLQAVRAGIASNVEISGLAILGAFDAIRRLGEGAYAGLDPHVARKMSDAAVIASGMHRRYAADGRFDPAGFNAMFTPVVTACREAGVPMNAGT